jgi:hypothetical protein
MLLHVTLLHTVTYANFRQFANNAFSSPLNRREAQRFAEKYYSPVLYILQRILDTLMVTRVLTERRSKHYNRVRPYTVLGYLPLAPDAVMPLQASSALLPCRISVESNFAGGTRTGGRSTTGRR